MSVNRITIVGRLGNAPELSSKNETKYAKFSVATTESYKKNDTWENKVTWHNIIVWGQLAEFCAKSLAKGDQIWLEGKQENESYEDKDKVKRYSSSVRGHEIKLLSKSTTGEIKGEGEEDSSQKDYSLQNGENGNEETIF